MALMVMPNLDSELPPRARRIPLGCGVCIIGDGTTSACAENTWGGVNYFGVWWNYLRVRGEYLPLPLASRRKEELPPRARRILHRGVLAGD